MIHVEEALWLRSSLRPRQLTAVEGDRTLAATCGQRTITQPRSPASDSQIIGIQNECTATK